MSTGPALWALGAAQVARMVRGREVSAVEVARAALARLDEVNPWLNAVVEHRPQELLARAAQIDAQLARGEDPGPLAGVPVTIKVNVDQQGYATTNGLRSQANLIAASSSPVVDNLLKAGALPVGRTNTPAFSYRWFTGNLLHGATRNPRDAALTPGGSSGGSASAVASGICAIGHGTDIAGSIRYPAYACGIHGLRPSFGRVPAYNASAGKDRSIGGQLMAVSGPLARSVEDLQLALAAMSAGDVRDPWWVPVPLEGLPVERKAALCFAPDGLAVCDEARVALGQAAQALRDAGWRVEEVEALPPLQEAVDLQIAMWIGDGYDQLLAAARAEGDPGAIAAVTGQEDVARRLGLLEFSDALSRRLTIVRKWQQFMTQQYPLVLMPTSAEPPFVNDLDLQGPEAYRRVWRAQMPMIALPVTGLPSLNLCTGLTPRGPMGVQLVAARFREDVCLAAGQAIEARLFRPEPVTPLSATG